MDVGAWLRSFGLGQYEAAFRENEIDSEVLPELTDADLEKLGAPLGHRKRLLKAIGALGVAAGPPPSSAPVSSPKADAAERRQLTVMFCDLVGSTAMSARLDPEDMRGIIGAYHKCCASLIEHGGGYVAKYMGDGVLAYFGYPRAHEHDAERAVQAGLAIVEAAPQLVTAVGATVHIRVGIATGIVVVGDLLGSGEAQERGVVGDTPNLAARLQGIAQPDSVVIAEGTRKLLGDLFELKDLGPQDLRGIAGPTRAYAALRESSQESRFEALHAGGLTALVGREEESELLLRRFAKAKAGEGQVVLLSGEAGIGKSRLTAALLERLTGEPHVRMRYFCSPQHTDSALYPIVGHMARAAGLAREDEAKARLDKLDALLARSATSCEDTALIAELLSLPNDGRYPALQSSPQQRRQKTLEALIRQIVALARETPVLMIFEDAHWADPSSLEVFGRLVDRIGALRVLLFVTFRPEFAPPWVGRPHVTLLTLNRLGPREVMALIDRMAGNRPLASNIRQDIVERADGIPLFVEEMTKALLEAEGEGAAARAIASIPSSGLAVPATLHASLMARLDRLGSAKDIAQIGATIGREFSHSLLTAVAQKSDEDLTNSLGRLVDAGLLFRQGALPNVTYLFKHALIQDAAYSTLLRESRRGLHARIAAALENNFPDALVNQPEILARHCAEAGMPEKAASYWSAAAQKSLARCALIEAIEQFACALRQIEAAPSTPFSRKEHIKYQAALIIPLMHVKGHAAPETRAAVERAQALIERSGEIGEPPDDPLLLFSVLYGLWVANYVGLNVSVIFALATDFQTLARKEKTAIPLTIADRLLGTSLLFNGDIAQARIHYDRAIAGYRASEHRALTAKFGQDNRVAALVYRAFTSWILGYPDSALGDAERAVRYARDLENAPSLMYALVHTPFTYFLCGDYAAARASSDELVMLADQKGALFWKAYALVHQGCHVALSGDYSEATELLSTRIAAFRSTGATLFAPWYLPYLALAYASGGNFDEALRCTGEALTAIETTGERWCEAEAHRIAGEIVLTSPRADLPKAEAHFERALSTARQQQARSWELRAAMSLARLRRDQGRRTEAYHLLAPIYGWFSEGFGTLDLVRAKALLNETTSVA